MSYLPRPSNPTPTPTPTRTPTPTLTLIPTPNQAREDEFLQCVVRPLYNFLKQEVLIRKEDPISKRSLYDDVNEAFWDRQRYP